MSLDPVASSSAPQTPLAPPHAQQDASLARPAVTQRRSFLGKIPTTIKKAVPSRLPFRGGQRRADLLKPVDPTEPPLGTLVIRLLAARDLTAKDRGGTSDPFAVLSYGASTVTSPTIPRTLNPVWSVGGTGETGEGIGGEAQLSVKLFKTRGLATTPVEIILWDKDRIGKEYLGEVSIGLDQAWGDPQSWAGGVPPVGLDDEDNKPIWHPLRSSRSRSAVTGALLVQVGFIPASASTSAAGSQSTTISDEERARLLAILQECLEKRDGSRRTSKEERVLLTSPMEGVGTHPLDDFRPLGATVGPLHHLKAGAENDEDDDSETSSESDSDSEGEETDTEGEYDDAGTQLETSTDDEDEILFTAVEPPADYFTLGPGGPAPKFASPEPETPPVPSIIVDAEQRPSLPTVDSSSSTLAAPPSGPKRGLSLPSFMKRRDSSKSVSSLMTSEAGNSDVNSDSSVTREKRKRFSRKKKVASAVDLALVTPGENAAAIAIPDGKKKRKGRKGRRQRRAEAAETSEGGQDEESGKRRRRRKAQAALGRRRTKRDYTYADDGDILGLVQIEVKGAKDLPRFKNAIRMSYDMDPFAVISFGRKVFRTRVIRHSLNPVWDEKLFFHVRQTEAHWNIAFNLYDWDKVSSNDHVGDVVVPLEQLLGTTVQPDERGLYPAGSDGKLIGDDFHPHDLKIVIDGKESGEREVDGKTPSTLQIRAKFTPYSALRQQFWRVYLRNYDIDESGTFSHIEIFSMLDSLGSTLTKETISSFFTRFNKTEDQELTMDQVVICLEQEVTKPKEEKRRVDESANSTAASTANSMPGTPGAKPASLSFTKPDAGAGAKPDQTDPSSNMQPIQPGAEIVTNVEQGTKISVPASRAAPARQDSLDPLADDSDSLGEKVERVVNIKECPLCHKPRMNSKAELDIITHMGVCSSTDPRAVNRIVVNEFVTASQAQRKWFTKIISKATKGAYQLGADSANIIVQDRLTGTLLEEKMAVYVRLGMRLAYRGIGPGGGMEGARIRRLLESMSIKQGVKFDSPASAREIAPFVDFHSLDLSEVLEPISSFKTFNEFFYRKLKPDARPVADADDPRTLVSPADCRAMFFETVSEATRIWIKGREFTVGRLLGEGYKEKAHLFENASLAIFRLAPQDYHRYHSPIDGVMGPLNEINGAYYTVNPIAIRAQIDVYGENKRTVGSITSPVFGESMHVWIGAMMVGSICMTRGEGEEVKRGDEVGYFKFGGSTIVCLFNNVQFDPDLVENSKNSIETLVRVGMRIGRKVE